jgi:hypothetical protein
MLKENPHARDCDQPRKAQVSGRESSTVEQVWGCIGTNQLKKQADGRPRGGPAASWKLRARGEGLKENLGP